MTIRFQADADFNVDIVRAIVRRERAIDFRTAKDAALVGVKDSDVLRIAMQSDRILVTHDQSTLPGHFYRFIATHDSPGIVIVPQYRSISEIADDLILIWSASNSDDWKNQIVYLPL